MTATQRNPTIVAEVGNGLGVNHEGTATTGRFSSIFSGDHGVEHAVRTIDADSTNLAFNGWAMSDQSSSPVPAAVSGQSE